MEIKTLPVKDWMPAEGLCYEADGHTLHQNVLKQVCEFNKVPATLLNIDKQFGTNTAKTVLATLPNQAELQFLIDDNGDVLSAIDPKSIFCPDDRFMDMLDRVQDKLGSELNVTTNGATMSASFDFPITEKDSFMGDVFSKSLKIERLPQGGIYANVGVVRLACTNGQLVMDSQYKGMFRNGVLEDAAMVNLLQTGAAFDVEAYFKALFTVDGQPVMSSVADFLDMKKTLAQHTDESIADLYYPENPIVEHYGAQKIDISKLSRTMLAKLPSGLSYYNCYNILTNGIKAATSPLTLDDKVKIGNYARPSRLWSMKQTDIAFSGMPHFDNDYVHVLMGDKS